MVELEHYRPPTSCESKGAAIRKKLISCEHDRGAAQVAVWTSTILRTSPAIRLARFSTSGGKGAAIGAGVGAAGGTGVAAATGEKNVSVAAGTPFKFSLTSPIEI
jgi:DnaJ-class molecular chaperone